MSEHEHDHDHYHYHYHHDYHYRYHHDYHYHDQSTSMTATVPRRARQGKKPPPQVEICIGGFKILKILFEKILLYQTIENVIDKTSPLKSMSTLRYLWKGPRAKYKLI